MRSSVEYCIDLPEDFPESELTKYMAFAREVLLEPSPSPAWNEAETMKSAITTRSTGAHSGVIFSLVSSSSSTGYGPLNLNVRLPSSPRVDNRLQ